MKKKKFKKVCLGIISFILILLFVSYVNHNICKIREEKDLISYGIGEQVELDGKNINVLTVGNESGNGTIVYMHGLGMGDTTVSAREMFEPLEEEYKICLVDRYGNGMSDDTNKEQTVSEITKLYRKVLSASGEKGPYILVAHSISGVYATYWAQNYPDEIKSIIYLDADPVECFVTEGKIGFGQTVLLYAQCIASELGIQRFFIKDEVLLGDTKNQVYSEKENKIRKYLVYRHSMSLATCSEFRLYYQNAKEVLDDNINLEIPQLYIVANQVKGDYFTNIYSEKLQEQFGEDNEAIKNTIDRYQGIVNDKIEIIKNRKNIVIKELSGPHCIYEYNPNEISNAMMSFLDN